MWAHTSSQDETRDRVWEDLYSRIVMLFSQYGHEDPCGDGDFWVVDDNYGWRRRTVNVFALKMLEPKIIARVRELLTGFPDWEIVLALDVPGKEHEWPHMGVTIRKHEIIDGLSRAYLPEPYRSMTIPGSRPGTGND
jgi:hypothetical protein